MYVEGFCRRIDLETFIGDGTFLLISSRPHAPRRTEKKATGEAELVQAKSGHSKTLKDLEALNTYPAEESHRVSTDP